MKPIESRLLEWYGVHGRADLPWRVVRDPYYTLVSEFMLQQTQVDRVVPKFRTFVQRFPTIETLAAASVADVLREWKGLGYNSRAVRLKRVAEAVVERHGGRMPESASALLDLPGIGPYTASAIRAFAFDVDDLPVDTNVRRIVERVGQPLEPPGGKAHDWASALMDLGATICKARVPKCLLCPLQSECASAPLSPSACVPAPRKRGDTVPFEKTARYARGRVIDRLRELPPGKRISFLDLHRDLEPLLPGRTVEEVRAFVRALERDGLIARDGESVALAE
ncbi:MAG TPA: A/G-specific adenine glycosylase [Candidatus Baltobacteraceae bacterium]